MERVYVRRPYTAKEDKIIAKYVRKNPNNLSSAFREATRELDRTERSISVRWYRVISKRPAVIFTTLGVRVANPNRKIISHRTSDTSIRVKEGIWGKVLSILGLK